MKTFAVRVRIFTSDGLSWVQVAQTSAVGWNHAKAIAVHGAKLSHPGKRVEFVSAARVFSQPAGLPVVAIRRAS